MNEKIVKFIKDEHILTLGVNSPDGAYLCSCFYAFIEPNLIIVAFGSGSYHLRAIQSDNRVFINIALQTDIVGKIQGLQAKGVISKSDIKEHKSAYISRFAYARFMKLNLYTIRLNWLKFTDNSLGFGKKIELNLA
ncbi:MULTISPECIES: hypothetical protein [Campylobacter]|uniref:Pyridoxine 5'-phosphate oxidase family n=1 Tax=Campylobacter porcelli TaxID=1660073 RepID=A0A1X9SV56_9BACT|nr:MULTISPECIES: hypothetical protein [unclassified Campylobacter]MCR8679198.1 hypothetical protein [Campylobacter sp. RM19072]MCR8696704.1 hypothetical protein [Campylobacter sp. RM19073]MEE3705153.1 hypothetical protein [Campylobacter sp. CX2-8023-23]MEE3744774.1 hypothetical protein [Campylobacter sp. CX2-4855-23]MEE3777098.1 hypothetical protein [Campylobacter sp. CX2-4080-23]